jgi:hypothetical protein
VFDYLGLSAAHTHCENQRLDWQERLKNTKQGIGKFWKELTDGRKCELPPISCECCTGDRAKIGGYWSPTEKRIVLCENNLPVKGGWTEYGRRITHELIHAAQQLCYKWESGGCRTSVCKEIQAYAFEHKWGAAKGRSQNQILDGVLVSSFCACATEMVVPWDHKKSCADNAKGKEEQIKERIKNEFNAIFASCSTVIGMPVNLPKIPEVK